MPRDEFSPSHDDSVWAEAAREADHEALLEAAEYAVDLCIYDNETRATSSCENCGVPLCSGCGFSTDTGGKLCNKCFETIHAGGI